MFLVQIVSRLTTAEEYAELRRAVGWRVPVTGVVNLTATADVAPFYEQLGYEDSGSRFMGKAVR